MQLPYFAAALLFSVAAAASPARHAEDFDAAWRAIDQGYAYFGNNRAAWQRARTQWRPRAARAKSQAQFIAALEGALETLRDDNIWLSERGEASARRVPMDTDIWARWDKGAARVEAVRAFGDADVAGLKPGHRVTRIDDRPVDKAVADRLNGGAANAEARDWALRHALAGPRAGIMRLEAADGDSRRVFEIARARTATAHGPALVARRVGDQRDLGYVRIRSYDDPRALEQFEGALHNLADTRGLIFDLRDATGPASREVTRAILGHFTATETRWQLRERPGTQRVADMVAPRGERYRAPVVVLVDRWTAGEGEALAAGLAAVSKARLVGTPMAGLRGELRQVTLPHSGIVLAFPGERTYHVDGTPRERLKPHVAVDLAAPSGGPGDPILYQALKLLE